MCSRVDRDDAAPLVAFVQQFKIAGLSKQFALDGTSQEARVVGIPAIAAQQNYHS